MINNLILFDGVCSLCNGSVDLIVRNENGNALKFASLQSDLGKEVIKKSGLENVPDSILFYSEGTLYAESDAVLRVVKFLKMPYKWLVVFRVMPRMIRDGMYRLIARNRYRWFGKRDTCRVPTAQEREKILG
jgi:predicted DCC family thiol-disulfide oxidoreductase YuxK|tara:strand:- start:1514 stop:1909 length:396 start_codon:yes stop_codon:yes gene_type:complete